MARLGRLRGVRVVSRERVGVLAWALQAGAIWGAVVAEQRGVGRSGWVGGSVGSEERLRGVLPDHRHDCCLAVLTAIRCCLQYGEAQTFHTVTKTGWCLCLRGIVARLLQWTCLARRGQEASRPGVPVLAEATSRDPGWRCGEKSLGGLVSNSCDGGGASAQRS